MRIEALQKDDVNTTEDRYRGKAVNGKVYSDSLAARYRSFCGEKAERLDTSLHTKAGRRCLSGS